MSTRHAIRTACLALLLTTSLPLSALPFSPQQRDTEKMIDERFEVSSGGTLEVDVSDANVELITRRADGVHVEVFLEGRDMDLARDYFERQNFEVYQRGSTVVIETDPRPVFRLGRRAWRDQPTILVQVHLPEVFNADLHTSDGDIVLGNMEGALEISTSDGDVEGSLLRGPRLQVRTSDGDIVLREALADHVSLRTSDGNIRAERLEGEVSLHTSDGDLRIGTIRGEQAAARTSDGDITIEELVTGYSTVHTSDGRIDIGSAYGDLEVVASDGDIRVDFVRPGAVLLRTSDGNITLTAPDDVAADLRLRGNTVRLSSSFAFNGRLEDEYATGALNGGGPTIEARASDGRVTLSDR